MSTRTWALAEKPEPLNVIRVPGVPELGLTVMAGGVLPRAEEAIPGVGEESPRAGHASASAKASATTAGAPTRSVSDFIMFVIANEAFRQEVTAVAMVCGRPPAGPGLEAMVSSSHPQCGRRQSCPGRRRDPHAHGVDRDQVRLAVTVHIAGNRCLLTIER